MYLSFQLNIQLKENGKSQKFKLEIQQGIMGLFIYDVNHCV